MTCGAECGHTNFQVAMPWEFPEGAIPPPGGRGGGGGRAFERALWGITASWIGRDDWGGCRLPPVANLQPSGSLSTFPPPLSSDGRPPVGSSPPPLDLLAHPPRPLLYMP
ncbi:hypothetical protein BKA82DRAFT_4012986 [Pisolithus tinctorius]|nr:hypothetical protein BKA82DRAFT_4012986 [Pisolithus tinctorius]